MTLMDHTLVLPVEEAAESVGNLGMVMILYNNIGKEKVSFLFTNKNEEFA